MLLEHAHCALKQLCIAVVNITGTCMLCQFNTIATGGFNNSSLQFGYTQCCSVFLQTIQILIHIFANWLQLHYIIVTQFYIVTFAFDDQKYISAHKGPSNPNHNDYLACSIVISPRIIFRFLDTNAKTCFVTIFFKHQQALILTLHI